MGKRLMAYKLRAGQRRLGGRRVSAGDEEEEGQGSEKHGDWQHGALTHVDVLAGIPDVPISVSQPSKIANYMWFPFEFSPGPAPSNRHGNATTPPAMVPTTPRTCRVLSPTGMPIRAPFPAQNQPFRFFGCFLVLPSFIGYVTCHVNEVFPGHVIEIADSSSALTCYVLTFG
ncbi:hypothetical protein SUGI_0659590 [Cryptomeria japonica]|nr:hypothetical protein SUGI_0659590 [Cryptomeria japonica]